MEQGKRTKEWSTQGFQGVVYATCNANVSLKLGGPAVDDFLDGKTMQLTTLADSARIVGNGHMGAGVCVTHEEHPHVKFVSCAGLTDQFTEVRFVNGGKAVRASARRGQGIPKLYSYVGVEFPYGGRETEVGVCWSTNTIGQSWTELEASHKLSDSCRVKLQFCPDKNVSALSCHFTI